MKLLDAIRIPQGMNVVCALGFLCVGCLTATNSLASTENQTKPMPKCLYISSYHKGYDWSDGVEQGVRSELDGHCIVHQLDMDTKRNKSAEFMKQAAKDAFDYIESWKPDIVITSDDNAAKYLIVPYKDRIKTPIVFSGINWTVEEYGFPFPNVTGIVEVAPIEPMLSKAMRFSNGHSAIYLGAQTLSEEKNFMRIELGAKKLGIDIEKRLVSTFDEWIDEFNQSQYADFVVMGSNSGILDWDEDKATAHAKKHTRRLSVSNHAWMMDVTSLGFTKIPQEHGEWAAQASLAILNGTKLSQIPIVTNRKWELWMNNELVKKSNTVIPPNLSRKAKRIASLDE